MSRLLAVLRHRLMWPAAVLVLLIAVNVVVTPTFLSVELRDGNLYGSLIDILRQAAPLALIGIGMTLVIATGGIDLSVGSVAAISGAVACLWISKLDNQDSVGGVLVAIALAMVLSVACGLWNGVLVSVVGIQPIIATLILMVAGRGVAQLITEGQIITIASDPYKVIGSGYASLIPFSVLMAAIAVAIAVVLTRLTALGLMIESIGGNPTASRLSGILAGRFTIIVYAATGLCAGIAGLIYTSSVNSADGSGVGNLIELDAILAVVIGGTALTGGRFSLAGTVLGAVIIETIDTSIVALGVPSNANLLFKAVVVVALFLAQSPEFRSRLAIRRRPGPPASKEPAQPDAKVEVPA